MRYEMDRNRIKKTLAPTAALIILLPVLFAGCHSAKSLTDGSKSGNTASTGERGSSVQSSGTSIGSAENDIRETSDMRETTSSMETALGKDVMPIGAWVSPPPENAIYGQKNPNYITDANYKLAKEAGLNIIYGLYENVENRLADVQRALDAAQANGLKYLVRDANAKAGIDDEEMMQSALEVYKNHPAYLGNLIQDEPSIRFFEMLGAYHNNYRKVLPHSYFYINILPNYASKNQIHIDVTDERGGVASTEDYAQYLREYMDVVKPQFISYDYYPLEGEFPSMKQGYFENMSLIRKVSMEHKIPFWVFIQSCSYNAITRIPVRAETLWQVNTALAYGAQGIQYFTFWTPLESDDFQGAMITKTGEITQVYYDVQAANRQIAAVDHVLMNAVSQGVVIHKDSPVPIPEEDILRTYGELVSLEGETPVLVGCFDNAGQSAYYVVNNTIEAAGNTTMNFNTTVSVSVTQNGVTTQKTGESLVLQLEAGEGVLVEINTK